MNTIPHAARGAVACLCAVAGPIHLAAADAPDQEAPLWSRDLGEAELQLLELSAITQVAVGGSSGDGHQLEATQSGAHDPNRDGFTFQQLELSVTGAVDPYFRAEAHLLVTPGEGLELEEGFAVTTGLPHGLEVETGYMLTEFGRYNPVHSHVYAYNDQPLVIGSMLGSEGMRDVGVRLGWLLPLDWYSNLDLTVQNADDETMISFLGEGHDHGGGEEEAEEPSRNIDSADELLYSGRWTNGTDLGDDSEVLIGLSAAYGPNLEDDHTVLYGADVTFKWYNPDAAAGAGTLSWTTEFIGRDYGHSDGGSVSDWGLVSTLVYDPIPRWRVGLRLDLVELEEAEHEEEEHEEEEHAAGSILRIAPLVAYRPSEFTQLRLQYNYSDIEDDEDVHSVWLGLEVLVGAHPAHEF